MTLLRPWALKGPSSAASWKPVDRYAPREELIELARGAQGVRSARMARALLGKVKLDPLRRLEREVGYKAAQPSLNVDIGPSLEGLSAREPGASRVLLQAYHLLKDERCLSLLGMPSAPAEWLVARGNALEVSPPLFATADELKRALEQPLPDPRFATLGADLWARGWLGWNESQLEMVPKALEKLASIRPADESFVREQLQPLRDTPFARVNFQALALMIRLADTDPGLDGVVADSILEGELPFGLNQIQADFLSRAAERGWRPTSEQRELLLSCVELPDSRFELGMRYRWENSARALSVLNRVGLGEARLALPDGQLCSVAEWVKKCILDSSEYDLGRDLAQSSRLAAEVGRSAGLTLGDLEPTDDTRLGMLVACREHGVLSGGDEILNELMVRPSEGMTTGDILDPLRQKVLDAGMEHLLSRDLSLSERLDEAERLLDVAVCVGARPGGPLPHERVLEHLELGLRSTAVDQATWSAMTGVPDAPLRLKLLHLVADKLPLPGVDLALQRSAADGGPVEQLSHAARSRFILAECLSREDRRDLLDRIRPDLEAFGGHVHQLGQSYDFVQSALSKLAGEDYERRLSALKDAPSLERTEDCLKLLGRGPGLLDFQMFPTLQEVWRGRDTSWMEGSSLASMVAMTANPLTARQRSVLLPEMIRSTPTEHARNDLLEPHRRAEVALYKEQLAARPSPETGARLVRDGAAMAESLPEYQVRIENSRAITPTSARVELAQAWLGLPLADEESASAALALLESVPDRSLLRADLTRILHSLDEARVIPRACAVYLNWKELEAQGMDSDRAFQQALQAEILDSPADAKASPVVNEGSFVRFGSVRVPRR